MKELEKKKLELQFMKASAAKIELECKILEREDDIKRMKDHIKLQEDIILKSKGALDG